MLLIHSLIKGHVGWFQYFEMMNEATVNPHMQVFVWHYRFGEHFYINSFIFLFKTFEDKVTSYLCFMLGKTQKRLISCLSSWSSKRAWLSLEDVYSNPKSCVPLFILYALSNSRWITWGNNWKLHYTIQILVLLLHQSFLFFLMVFSLSLHSSPQIDQRLIKM